MELKSVSLPKTPTRMYTRLRLPIPCARIRAVRILCRAWCEDLV